MTPRFLARTVAKWANCIKALRQENDLLFLKLFFCLLIVGSRTVEETVIESLMLEQT